MVYLLHITYIRYIVIPHTWRSYLRIQDDDEENSVERRKKGDFAAMLDCTENNLI